MEKIKEEYFLQMSPWDFDQSPEGWRSLDASGNRKEAIRIIKKYLIENKNKIEDPRMLYFHTGQLLAFLGSKEYKKAIDFFKLCFYENRSVLWNAYVSATIGFLCGDINNIDKSISIIEASKEKDKRSGNLNIIKNFKKALEMGNLDYEEVYLWPRD